MADAANQLLRVDPFNIPSKYLKGNQVLHPVYFFNEKMVSEKLETRSLNEIKLFCQNNSHKHVFLKLEVEEESSSDAKAEQNFDDNLKAAKAARPDELAKSAKENVKAFKNRLSTAKSAKEKIEAIHTASDKSVIQTKANLSNIEESLGDNPSEAFKAGLLKDHKVSDLRKASEQIVEETLEHLEIGDETSKVLHILDAYREGNTLAHIRRVYLHFIHFIKYFNYIASKGLHKKLELLFSPGQKYALYYKKSINDVFYERLRPFTPSEIHLYSLGALFHDLGKLPNIDYFESDAAYNRDIIELHAIKGYNLLYNAGDYPEALAYLAGSHHEYNMHEKGYGVRRYIYQRYNKNKNKTARLGMTYNFERVKNFEIQEFLPNSMLSIIDVYDALMCSKRRYRDEQFSQKQALGILKDMVLSERKLDLVLFDIFVGYVASGLSQNAEVMDFNPDLLLRQK